MQSRNVQPGDLDQLIDVQVETTTADDLGGRSRTWTTIRQHWAQVTPLIGREGEAHGTLRAVARVRFTIYADRDITARHRIVWDGRVYNVTEPRYQATHHRFMDVIAEAGAQS